MTTRRTGKTYYVSEQTIRLIEEMGALFDLSNAAVLARAVAALARQQGLAVVPEHESPRRPHGPRTRTIADPPGPIGDR
jgi:hypothetical protein